MTLRSGLVAADEVGAMAAVDVEVTIERRASAPVLVPGRSNRHESVVVLGKSSETNRGLVSAFTGLGYGAWLAEPSIPPRLTSGDIAVARLDVVETLDGVEPGLWQLPRLARRGVEVMNGPFALLAAHDKLSTALLLGRAGVPQPRTAHVREVSLPRFGPPYVVKPRFGSWGRDVYLCRDDAELRARLERLEHRHWFRRQGALVQSLVEPTGRDLRLVVAGERVVGAVERTALPGEWRTNVALGAVRRHVSAPPAACELALRAVTALGIDLAGVDIATDASGRGYVLEVNGAVDFNATYADDVFTAAAVALLERAVSRSLSRRATSFAWRA